MKKIVLLIASVLISLSVWGQDKHLFQKEFRTNITGITEKHKKNIKTGKHVSKKEFKQMYGISPSRYYALRGANPSTGTNRLYKWKLHSTNTLVGSCLIGGSVTAALLSNAILSQKAENTYDNDYADTQRIIYYSCAGVSLAGIIVILTGLHKEYIDGIKVAENWVIKDNGAGLSLSCKF